MMPGSWVPVFQPGSTFHGAGLTPACKLIEGRRPPLAWKATLVSGPGLRRSPPAVEHVLERLTRSGFSSARSRVSPGSSLMLYNSTASTTLPGRSGLGMLAGLGTISFQSPHHAPGHVGCWPVPECRPRCAESNREDSRPIAHGHLVQQVDAGQPLGSRHAHGLVQCRGRSTTDRCVDHSRLDVARPPQNMMACAGPSRRASSWTARPRSRRDLAPDRYQRQMRRWCRCSGPHGPGSRAGRHTSRQTTHTSPSNCEVNRGCQLAISRQQSLGWVVRVRGSMGAYHTKNGFSWACALLMKS